MHWWQRGIASLSALGLIAALTPASAGVALADNSAASRDARQLSSVTASTQTLQSQEEALWAGSGTEADPYRINNADDLDKLRQAVDAVYVENAVKTYGEGVVWVLDADIDMASYSDWDPIGSFDSATSYAAFAGTLDGQGHRIKNLKKSVTLAKVNGYTFGLFDAVDNAAITNVIFDSTCEISIKGAVSGTKGLRVGLLSAMSIGSSVFQNLGNEGTINVFNGQVVCGGLVGWATGTSEADVRFEKCYNKGNISYHTEKPTQVSLISLAGIAAHVENGLFKDCYNTGTIYAQGGIATPMTTGASPHVAGIGATFNGTQSAKGYDNTFEKCYNIGLVVAERTEGKKDLGQDIEQCQGNIGIGAIFSHNAEGLKDFKFSIYDETYVTKPQDSTAEFTEAALQFFAEEAQRMGLYWLEGSCSIDWGNGRRGNSAPTSKIDLTIKLSEAEMKDGTLLASLGDAFAADLSGDASINGGFPVLAWELPSVDTDEDTDVAIDVASAKVSVSAQTYTAKALNPQVTVNVAGKTLSSNTDYTISFLTAQKKAIPVSALIDAGTYYVRVQGKGAYTGTYDQIFTVDKAKGELAVKAKASQKKTAIKAKRTKAKTIAPSKYVKVISKTGSLEYKIAKIKKADKKKISLKSATGKIKIKKGLKKGVHTVKVKVRSKATANYMASPWKTITVKIRVK